MKLNQLLPKSLRNLRGTDKTVVTVLGGLAIGATALYLLDRSKDGPKSPGSRVAGAFTDLAKSLGMDIGTDMDVKTAQKYLNQVNHAGLDVDGKLGPLTATALKAFQAGNNIEQTGRLDEETANALQYFAAATSKNPKLQQLANVPVTYTPTSTPAPVTYTPMTAPGYFAQMVATNPALGAPFTRSIKMSIKGAQRALNDLTNASLPMTGHLDHATTAALQNFQGEQNLPMTGHIDSETANALLYLAGQARPQRIAAYRRAPTPGGPYMPHATGAQSTNLYDPRFVYGY